MTVGKGAALALALAGAMGFGVWIGPYLTHDRVTATFRQPVDRQATQAAAGTRSSASAPRVAARATPVIAPSTNGLQQQLKPLLNKGANMTVAAEGFRNAEQFAAVAHAARNTEVPFMLLKHRVLNEGKTLATAIKESKPDLDSEIEATRARAEARSDLARLAG